MIRREDLITHEDLHRVWPAGPPEDWKLRVLDGAGLPVDRYELVPLESMFAYRIVRR